MTSGSGSMFPAHIVALALAYVGAKEGSELEHQLGRLLDAEIGEEAVRDLLEMLPAPIDINAETCREMFEKLAF